MDNIQAVHWVCSGLLLLRAGVGQIRQEDRHLGQLSHHGGVWSDHIICTLVRKLNYFIQQANL